MKIKWLIYSISGLLLNGFGLSLLGEAIKFKINEDFYWFYMGTLALIVFNSGICFIGKAIFLKVKMSKKN
tara:strand:- start:977 stop:1186 length:210 start_codon:yes stop_codon:yes gene_type:complete